jgi:Bifunctional DNA primase/polymerase, N-terminal
MSAPSRPVEAPQTLAAALAYLDLGWSVIPAPVGAKRSLVPWKRYQQTRPRPDEWKAWARRWPRANLAVITGRLSGVVVVDVDPGRGGAAGIAGLEREHGVLPSTAVVATPSDGYHLYYRHPGGRVANSAGLLAPGVDVRGDGGLALLPPSRRGEGVYEWNEGGPTTVPPMPPWLDALVRPRAGTTNASSSVATTILTDARIAARFDAITRILTQAPAPAGNQPGGRNTALFWCALRLRDMIAEGAPESLAGDLENIAVDRGLSRTEAKATIASGLNQPRRGVTA